MTSLKYSRVFLNNSLWVSSYWSRRGGGGVAAEFSSILLKKHASSLLAHDGRSSWACGGDSEGDRRVRWASQPVLFFWGGVEDELGNWRTRSGAAAAAVLLGRRAAVVVVRRSYCAYVTVATYTTS